MSTLRTLTGDALRKYHQLYCERRRLPAGLIQLNDPGFLGFLKEMDATEKALSSTDPEAKRFTDHLLRLAPDWNRRRKLGNVRMKTFLRIYLSKWFWQGLEWQEREFVLVLLERTSDSNLDFLKENPNHLNRKGFFVVLEMELEDRQRSWNLKGFDLIQVNNLLEYIFTEQDFLAIWKLRSVQSIRDYLFVRVTGHEHEGKLGIRKPRIRGYRDGKASPRDPTLIKMALEVDRLFYEEQFTKRWDQFEEEISRFCST